MYNFFKSIVFIIFITNLSFTNTYSQNLITNGDFGVFDPSILSPPPLGYTTTYTLIPYTGSISSSTGKYAVTNNPYPLATSDFRDVYDHPADGTPGNGTGNMLFVDGKNNQVFWKQSPELPLLAGVKYVFSFWIRNINKSGPTPGPKVMINAVGCSNCTTETYAPNDYEWHKVSYAITPTVTESISIELSTVNSIPAGNNFAIDDVRLLPPPLPLTISTSKIDPSCANISDGIIVGYENSAVAPFTYKISGVDGTPNPTISSNSSGVFSGLSAGSYVVSVTDSYLPPRTMTTNKILLNAPPDISLSSSPSGCVALGSAVTLTAANGGSLYNWSASSGVAISDTDNIAIVNPTENTVYTVNSSTSKTNFNLITNGDFELGNDGFYSDYYNTSTKVSVAKSSYGIVSNPKLWDSSLLLSTDKSGLGKMLVADGSSIVNSSIWSQTVLVEPSKSYDFSFWVQNLASTNFAQFSVLINGLPIIISPVSASNNGVSSGWNQITGNWLSGSSTLATIEIKDINNLSTGNDFALDEIKFSTSNSRSCTLSTTLPIKVTISSDFAPIAPFCSGSAVPLLSTTSPNLIKGTWSPAIISNTTSGTYTFTPDNTLNPCAIGQILTTSVSPNMSTGVASSSPTLCINTVLTEITHSTSGVAGIGTVTGLPLGITPDFSGNTLTINGTPTETGTFNYSIPLLGGCGTVSATGKIIVSPNNTVSAASSSPTLCVNTILPNITHTTTGVSGVGAPMGLPLGIGASFSGNTITISGTPTVSGIFNYSIPLQGGCGITNAVGTITVDPINTVDAASSSPTLCVNQVLTDITHNTTRATGIGSNTGLPTGVAAVFASNRITISGTPTTPGTFNYEIPLIGGCGLVNATGTIVVNPNNTVGIASSFPSICINSTLTDITHATTIATGIGSATGLPLGITTQFSGNTIIISGTPSVSGTFNYNIPLIGGCGPSISAIGTITVKPNNTIGAASSSPSLCINTILTDINHISTGSTGIGLATGLPAGVSPVFSSNMVTVKGTPSESGIFNYSIPLTGGCDDLYATGTITVIPNNTAGAPSSSPTICIDTLLTDITHSTTGATGIGTASNLPAGLTAVFGTNIIIISGTPTASGTFNYSIPLTGGCGALSANGTITVIPNNTVGVASSSPTLCINTIVTDITYNTTGFTGIDPALGLPAGVNAIFSGNKIIVSGKPTASGLFNYSIPLTGGCGAALTASGTIEVTPENTAGLPSSTPTLCINTVLTDITHLTTGATGIGPSSNLPAGVLANFASNKITIIGTPTSSGIFNYTIPLIGGCGLINATGTITVNPDNTVGIASLSPTLCINTVLPIITHNTTVATGIGTAIGLPTGVDAVFASNKITISGTPSTSGVYNYSIPLTGGCGVVLNAVGTITVVAEPISGTLYGVQAICTGSSALFSSDASGGTWSSSNTSVATVNSSTGLVSGVGAGTAMITYTVLGTGGCFNATSNLTVTVTAAPVSGIISGSQNICLNLTTLFTTTGVGGLWSSSDTSIATVNSSTGVVNGNNLGTATIFYKVIGTGGCLDATSQRNITIDPIVTPVFDLVTPVCYDSVIPDLPLISKNGITGTWFPALNNKATTTYTFSPTAGLCAIPTTLEIEVIVLPLVIATPNKTSVCSNTAPSIAISSDIIGATFSWTIEQTKVTGASSGSGNLINQVLNTVSNESGEAIYKVAATAYGCVGLINEVKIIVNPTADVIATPDQETICSGQSTNIVLSSNVIGTTYNWTTSQNGVLGAFSSTANTITQILKTSGTVPGYVDYTITPVANGCNGNPIVITIKVNPTPQVFGSPATTICSDEATNIVLSPNILGTEFNWTVAETNVTGATNGSGDSINQILEAGLNVGKAVYTVTPGLNGCNGAPLNITVNVNPAPIPRIEDGIICVSQSTGNTIKNYLLETNLDNGSFNFKWYFEGIKIESAALNNYEASEVGQYSVVVTNRATGCVSKSYFADVIANFPATSFTATVSDAFTQDATITTNVQGGTGPFLYQLDNGLFQNYGVFTNLKSGVHKVVVIDPQGCTNLSTEVLVIDYPKFFTPNGDGYNDTWNINALNDSRIFIYDRYGKLLKQINSSGAGWDGTLNSQNLPATDYWFTVDYLESNINKIFKSHFSLKR